MVVVGVVVEVVVVVVVVVVAVVGLYPGSFCCRLAPWHRDPPEAPPSVGLRRQLVDPVMGVCVTGLEPI